MSTRTLSELLASHRDKEWFPLSPASEAEVAQAERTIGQEFPADYRDVLRAFGAGVLYGAKARVLLIPLEHLSQFNPDPDPTSDLREMFYFADDEGPCLFFFDPSNRMERGAWAVFAVDKGARATTYSTFVAGGFRELCERVLAGERLEY